MARKLAKMTLREALRVVYHMANDSVNGCGNAEQNEALNAVLSLQIDLAWTDLQLEKAQHLSRKHGKEA